MIHGRGSSAADILQLAPELGRTDLTYLAPEAPTGQWYPARFMEPIERNEPGITWGMQAIDDVMGLARAAGIDAARTVILGFSQGACLTLEYAARHAQRYGGIVGFSGGLIGPDDTPRNYSGTMDGTPVFLGCSDIDFHIPVQRVHATADVFERLGAAVTTRIYPGMGHTINEDEIVYVRTLLENIAAGN
jgi:predicted esterase